MGQFFCIKCEECGKEEQFSLGRGYLPLEPFAYEEITKKKEYENLRPYVLGPEYLYDAGYKIYYCKECKTLEKHISFRVRNLTSFRSHRKCRKCGKVMKGMADTRKLWTQKIELKCRKCGTEYVLNMEEIFTGMWD